MSPTSDFGHELDRILQNTIQAWSEAQSHWSDQKASIFESNHWSIVNNDSSALLQVLEELENIIESSKRTIQS